jgi:hypothetical protein
VPLGTATAKRSSSKIHFNKNGEIFLKHSIQGPFITAGASKIPWRWWRSQQNTLFFHNSLKNI